MLRLRERRLGPVHRNDGTGKSSNSPARSFRMRSAFFLTKNRSKSSPKFGRRKIDDIHAVSIGYRKSYGGFGTFVPLGPTFELNTLHGRMMATMLAGVVSPT